MTRTTYRIVHRAFGVYTPVCLVETTSYLDAVEYADRLERENGDGEYFVRIIDEPDHREPVHCAAQDAWSNL